MKIRLLFFGRLRERLQTAEETFVLDKETATAGDIAAALRARGGVWAEELGGKRALAFAVRQQFAAPEAEVLDGDEVAIFPPVTGG